MTHRAMAAAALALPVAALAALIAQGAIERRVGVPVELSITGVDPRDPLRGQFLRYRIAWHWEGEPDEAAPGLCLAQAGTDPPARPTGPAADPSCRLWLRRGQHGGSFLPAGLDGTLFVPEAQAGSLADALRPGGGGLHLRLAIRPDGTARVRGWSR